MLAHTVKVIAPTVRCMAQSDELKLLVAGCKTQLEAENWSLSVYQLDDAGNPKPGDPVRVELVRPEPLKTFTVYPLALMFHPKLPLLYVWQEITGPKRTTPEETAVNDNFDHLLIFAIKDGALTLVGSYLRGPTLAYDMNFGSLGISPKNDRLFFPNYRDNVNNQHGVGFYALDEQGMLKPTPVPIKGSLDGQGLEKFDLELRPTVIATTPHIRAVPTGMGFFAPLDGFLFMTNNQGIAMWDIENRRAPLGSIHVAYTPGDCFIGGNSKISAVYGNGFNNSTLFRVEHIDGYLTGLPSTFILHGSVPQTPPLIIVGKPNRMILGGVNFVHVLQLDEEGKFPPQGAAGSREDISVFSPMARGFAWSEKFGKLYIGVDKLQ